MFRKLLFGAVALAGLLVIPMQSADAGWRRAARRGYYYGPVARRYYRPRYVAPPVVYGPGYTTYGYPYGYSAYGYGYGYGPYGYGYNSGVGVVTPGFGIYVR